MRDAFRGDNVRVHYLFVGDMFGCQLFFAWSHMGQPFREYSFIMTAALLPLLPIPKWAA